MSITAGFPRDFWLEEWEKQAIIAFHLKNPLEGYRRLTFMMLDADIVAASPASMWRALSRAGLLRNAKVHVMRNFRADDLTNLEETGQIVRVEGLPDGKWGVAIHIRLG